MRLSKAIHAEIASGILYDKQKLEFTIQPETPVGQPYGVDVCFAGGRRQWQTKLSHSYYANVGFCESFKLRLQHWHEMPIHKFKGVVINILPPDQHDPGEVVSLWNDLIWLLGLLKNRGVAIEIKFKVTKTRNWIDDNIALPLDIYDEEPDWISQADARPRRIVDCSFDLFILLINQHNLRSVTTVEADTDDVEMAEAKNRQTSGDVERVDNVDVEDWSLHPEVRLEHNLQSTTTAEVDVDGIEVAEAEEQQQTFGVLGIVHDFDVAEWSLYLDILLDTLPGDAAERLRLERFATWSDEYFWSSWTKLRSSWSTDIQPGDFPVIPITSDKQPPPETVPASVSYDTLFIENEIDYLHIERLDGETYPELPNPALRSMCLRLLQMRLITYRLRHPFVRFYTKQGDVYGNWYTTEIINGADKD